MLENMHSMHNLMDGNSYRGVMLIDNCTHRLGCGRIEDMWEVLRSDILKAIEDKKEVHVFVWENTPEQTNLLREFLKKAVENPDYPLSQEESAKVR